MELMHVNSTTGLVSGACYLPSPNCDARPEPVEISVLVVHGISLPPGEFGGRWIDDLFCNRLDPTQHPYFATIAHQKVSAHFLIRRTGELIQYVPLSLRAWHAGASSFAGRERCNDFSIGVELEGSDDQPYADAQYATLAGLSEALLQAFPALTAARIVGPQRYRAGP